MKARLKANPEIEGFADTFNINSVAGEVIFNSEKLGCTSEPIKNIEVYCTQHPYMQKWINLADALRVNAVISDDGDYRFREPLTKEEKERGWF